MDKIIEIKKDIVSGRTSNAIHKLLDFANSQDAKFRTQVIALSNQFNRWNEEKKIGLESDPEELRRIEYNLLRILPETGELDEEFINTLVNNTYKVAIEDDLELMMEDISLGQERRFTRLFAGVIREYSWLVNLPITVSSEHITIDSSNKVGKTTIHCEKMSLNHDIEIFGKNAKTVRSWGWWNMKASKDVEFWSSVVQISKEMIAKKIINDSNFKSQLLSNAQKEISKLTRSEKTDIQIDGLQLFDGKIVSFN